MPNPPLTFSASSTYEEALERAATVWGVECEYWDIWGKLHRVTREGMVSVLAALRVDTSSLESLDAAVENRLWRQWSQVTPLTAVISGVKPGIRLRTVGSQSHVPIDIDIELEDGSAQSLTVRPGELAETGSAQLRGIEYRESLLPLPDIEGRLGYHRLRVRGASSETRLIVTPDRAYFPRPLSVHDRAAGLAISLYGVRSERNWGCGDFTDLKNLIAWSATDLGASFIALNPLPAIQNRQPYNTSPYLPTCSFYRNFIYLDIEAIPDFADADSAALRETEAVRLEISALCDAEFVEYERIARLKQRFLKLLFEAFLRNSNADDARSLSFLRYVEREGALLDDYAVFCALDEVIHRENPDIWLWSDWPAEYQDPRSAATREFARVHEPTVRFYKYVQWQIDEQLAAAQRHAVECGMSIGIYHDLALATDRFGADLWAYRPFYVNGCRVGSPPDGFSPNGQDWSFPPPNADVHFEDGYRLFVESIRKNARHGGALRIDHVMRFFHLFWIPDQLDPKLGLYVRDHHEDLIRILALESVRDRFLIVGEDLGTVADEIRETLERFGILSYRLLYFEKVGDRFKLPHEYPKQALVSVSTHDLPTLAGFWEGRDILARQRAGMFHFDIDHHRQLEERKVDKQRLLDLLFAIGLMPKDCSRSAADYLELTGELHHAVIGFLATTPSALMVISEEDLMKQIDQQNLPGTCAEYPNWRHKTRFTVEELRQPPASDFALMCKSWLHVTGRLKL